MSHLKECQVDLSSSSQNMEEVEHITIEQTLESVYLDYGFFLHKLNNLKAARMYWLKAGFFFIFLKIY